MNERRAAEVKELVEMFGHCKEVLVAIGDENRLHIIIEMMLIGKPEGLRVGDITERTHLSRPAVSHHVQILKKAGVLAVRKEGTKNYYSFAPGIKCLDDVIGAFRKSQEIAAQI